MPPIASTSAVVIGIVCIAVVFLLFSLVKGVIKLLLLAAAATCAVAAWIFLQKNGFTFLSLAMNNPRPWMVQTCAWGAAIFVFAVFFHGMNWFAQLFSWHHRGASASSICTTVLMCALLLWVTMLGISYYGDVSLIRHYHLRATAAASTRLPQVTRFSNALRASPMTAWLTRLNPMDDQVQTKLACLVAYGCSLDEQAMQAFYTTCLENSGIPQPSRFLDLFRDKGLRTLVQEGRFVNLLENSHLKTFLRRSNTQDILEKMQLR